MNRLDRQVLGDTDIEDDFEDTLVQTIEEI